MLVEFFYRADVWLLLLLAFVLYCTVSYFNTRHDPPGPWGLPVVGYLPFLGRKMNLTVTKLAKKYGEVFQLRLGSRKVVFINGQRAVKNALIGQSIAFAGRPDFYTFQTLSGFGFADYSPSTRVYKKYTMKAFGEFTNVRREELQSVAHNAVAMIIRKLKEANNEPFDPKRTLEKVVCTIMGYICYGQFFDIEDEEVTKIIDLSRNFAEVIAFGVVIDFFPWAKVFLRKRLRLLQELMDALKAHSDKLAKAHIESYDGETIRDVSDMFRKLAENMSDEERIALKVDDEMLKENVSDLFGAGFSTTMSTLRYAFLIMSLNRDVQTRVQEEVDRVIGTDRVPEYEDESRMPYTCATLAEVYRHHSLSAFAATRATTKDTVFEGFTIRKGTPVIFNLYSAHRDETVFRDPEKFCPDRFFRCGGELDKSKIECVMPYSLGQRRCAGEPLARKQIFLIFSSVMQQCSVEESPAHPIDLDDYVMGLGIMHGPSKMVFRSRKGEW